MVQQIKRNLEKEGWKVKADLPGSEKPDPIGQFDRIPDIQATKSGHTRLIEVETNDSMESDRDQRASLQRSQRKLQNSGNRKMNRQLLSHR